jgi:hypothetical protein
MSSKPLPSEDIADNSSSRSQSEKGVGDHVIPKALLQDAELITKSGNIVTKDGGVISTQESDASLATNIFADPEVKAYYVALYEKSKYECRHVFDADLTWTKEEEKALVRKLDWRGSYPDYFIYEANILTGMY